MRKDRLKKWLPLAIIILLLFLIPAFTQSPYYFQVLVVIGIYVILTSGFRLILTTGQLSMAQVGFMGIGAYASTLLTTRLGLSVWASLPVSGVVAGICAIPIGWVTLRLRGVFFTIATFALGEVLRLTWTSRQLIPVFGGPAGLYPQSPEKIGLPGLPAIDFGDKIPYYYLTLVVVLISLLVIYRVEKSRVGMVFRCIKDADLLAQCIGVNIMKYKVIAFVVGCFFAGVAGSLFAHFILYVNPDSFAVTQTIDMVIYTTVGGQGSIIGPIVGTILFRILPEVLSFLRQYMPLVYGLSLILVMLLLRQGLVSLPQKLRPVFQKFSRGKDTRKSKVAETNSTRI